MDEEYSSKNPRRKAAPPPLVASHPDDEDPDLEVDTADLSDEDYDIDASINTSLATSIAKYRLENGPYLLPNDESENDRLDLQHHLCFLTLENKLYTCPAGTGKPLERVLDAGCGTGSWAIDFADEHPETEVIGVDLSPIQPSLVPPNTTFVIDDLEADWEYDEPFDFVYLRFLVGSIKDWDKLLEQAFKNLSPGGWIETMDAVYPLACDDETVNDDQAIYKWSNLMREGAAKAGLSLDTSLELKQKMLDQGFTKVTETWYKWPMNGWPKEPRFKDLGLWAAENVLSGVSALSLALFTRVLGWSRKDVETFLVEVRKDLKNKNIHGYWRILIVSGQKPESA